MSAISPKFNSQYPSAQSAVDIFKGYWKSAFPAESGIKAGEVKSFEDKRVLWVDQTLGGVEGRSILELGPFEAYHTWQFSELGADPIVAVEGSNINFLKCLVVKEALGIRASFLHGDIGCFMKNCTATFDLCWACGVLYHQTSPLELLSSIARVCRAVFIWTHFYDDCVAAVPTKYPHFSSESDVYKEHQGFRCRHHYRSYMTQGGRVPLLFSGGAREFAYWLRKSDILSFLELIGYRNYAVRAINMSHRAGPTMSVLAWKDDC